VLNSCKKGVKSAESADFGNISRKVRQNLANHTIFEKNS